MKTITKLSAILCLFLLNPFSNNVFAYAIPDLLKVTTSLSSGYWSDPTIWSDGRVPGDSSFVIIKTGHHITLRANSSCESLVIEQNAELNDSIFDLKLFFMGWAHGINDVGYDNGVSSFGTAPIDSTWDINNPNNGCWNIYKVDGIHSGSGNIYCQFNDFNSVLNRNDLGATVTGSGEITLTGIIQYYWIDVTPNGFKFNSACHLNIYANLNLVDVIPWAGFGLVTENFGQIQLKGSANIITGGNSGLFHTYPNASLTLENGSCYLTALTDYNNTGIFINDGLLQIQNGELYIPLGSAFQNDANVIINGNIRGNSSNANESAFFSGLPYSSLSITGQIFPSANRGTLSLTGMGNEPNYVIYNGTTPQSICTPTQAYDTTLQDSYSILVIENNAGVTLNTDITVNDNLTLTNGLVNLGSNNLILGTNCIVSGTPSASNMVVATGTGTLRKVFASAGSFTFPVGDNDGTPEYSPVTLNYTMGTFINAYTGVNLVNAPYPGLTGSHLNRYWNIVTDGITDFKCETEFNYVPADVDGTETDIYCYRVAPTVDLYNAANTTLHQLTVNNLNSFGTFTGKEQTASSKSLNLIVFLEGLYNGAGLMHKAQGIAGDQFLGTTADKVTVELHNASTGVIEYSLPNIDLSITGVITGSVPSVNNGSYYIYIIHRNSITVSTASPVSFAGSSISYDFSTGVAQAFGSNMKDMSGVAVAFAGEATQDCGIDSSDMIAVDNDNAAFASGYLVTDINGDGGVDSSDMIMVDNNNAAFIGCILPF